MPAVEAYYADNNTYATMTLAKLQSSYDAGIKVILGTTLTASAYCIKSTVGASTAHVTGPGAPSPRRQLRVAAFSSGSNDEGREQSRPSSFSAACRAIRPKGAQVGGR